MAIITSLLAGLRRRRALILLIPILGLGLAFVVLRYLYAIVASPDRAWRIAVGIDQAVNVSANGNEDETISSRADRARDERRPWGCVLCGVLDWVQKDHCKFARGT